MSTPLSPPPTRPPARPLLRRVAALIPALILVVSSATADEISADELIDAVTERLREQAGIKPDAEAVVGALNQRTEDVLGDGRYAEAEQIARIALDHAERVLDREHPNTLRSVNNLAALYYSQGRYGEAEPLCRRALEARERVLGGEHPGTLRSVNNLAALYQSQGRYGEAEPLYRRALEASERVLGDEHPDTVTCVNNLAALYLAQGRYGEAESLYRRALEASERVLGDEHPDTLTSVNNLAALYVAQGLYGEAEPLHRHALETRERALGKEHPDTLQSVNNLAALYKAQGRNGEAEPLYRRALEASERVLGDEHPDTLVSVNNLAGIYLAQGRYGEAEPLYRRALEASERVLGDEHPQTLASRNNLAALYDSQGRYGEAEPLYRRALEARERMLGREHPDTIGSINNLAFLYQAQGRYAEAEPLYRRALEACEHVLGREHPNTLITVNNLAMLYQAQGRYGEAEPYHHRALEANERMLGAAHPNTLLSVNNLAFLYVAQGRYGEAEPLYRRALETNEGMLGAAHPNTLISVNNLAFLHQTQGRYGEAEPLYRRALGASERVLGDEHPQTLGSVNNLAGLYNSQGRYDEAEPLFRRALEASERVLGDGHPQTLGSVNNLAFLYQTQGRYDEAEPLYRRALEARERVLGAEHPDTIQTQLNLVVTLINQDKIDPALAQLRIIDARLRRFVIAQWQSTESEQVRRQRLQSESRLQHIVFTLALDQAGSDPKGAAVRLAADVLLRWKRLAAEEEAVIARLARTSQDPRVVALADRIGAQRSAVSRLLNRSETDPALLAEGLARFGRLETELAALSQRFRGRMAGRGLEWEAVQAELPRGTALVELRAYRPVDFKTGDFGASRWLALVLAGPGADDDATGEDRDDGAMRIGPEPRLIDLGPVAATEVPRQALGRLTREALCLHQLSAAAEDETAAAATPDAKAPGCATELADARRADGRLDPEALRARLAAVETAADASAAELYRVLFGPLDQALAGLKTLVLAPDGALELVPFARLRLPDGRYWIERQALREVGTGRDLLPLPPADEALGMLAFGGVDYEQFANATADAATLADPAETPTAAAPNWRALNARLRAERGGFEPLRETAGEAATVGRYYWDYFGRKAEVITGADADEQRLRAITTAPRILHLATHGFFLDQRPDQSPDQGSDHRPYQPRRPLTLAGLALAGANRGLEGKLGPGAQDGLLYALEVQDLNLEGTRLAVLSACDTGRGAVDPSEGVYGLVRAFRVAGAEAVLMSLWPLNDHLAAEFMGDFYRTWLGAGSDADPAVALRATRLDWIKDRDPRRRDPAYWAPYVLIE